METRSPETSLRPHIALLGVQALFGSLPVFGKVVLAVIPAISLVGFRIGTTALILVVIQTYRRRFWLQYREDYKKLAVLSLFGVTFNQLLFIGGLSLTTASNTSLLAVTIPIFTLIISSIAGTERLRPAKIFGIMLAAAGILFLIDPRKASFSSATTLGDLMIIVNSLSYGTFVATSKETIMRNGPFRSTMWMFIFAAIVCVPLGLFTLTGTDVASVGSSIWLLILYIAIVATAGPYLLNAYALAKVNPSVVAVYIYLQPVIGFILAVVFLNEVLDAKFAAAAVCVFAGVYLTTRRRSDRLEHVTAA